jgi:hypothetical protein
MSNIIIPSGQRYFSAEDNRKLLDAVDVCVRRSMEHRPQGIYTEGRISQAEFKRRAQYCINTALRWRKDRLFSWEQIKDHLKTAVIHWLDGVEYEPRDGMWVDPDEPSNQPKKEEE